MKLWVALANPSGFLGFNFGYQHSMVTCFTGPCCKFWSWLVPLTFLFRMLYNLEMSLKVFACI